MEKDHCLEQLEKKDIVSRAYAWIQIWCEANNCKSQEWENIKKALLVFPEFKELTAETRDARWGDTLIGVVGQIEEEREQLLTEGGLGPAGNKVTQQIRDRLEQLGNKDIVSRAYTWIQIWCEANNRNSQEWENIKKALLVFPEFEELTQQTRDARWGDTLIGVVGQIEEEKRVNE